MANLSPSLLWGSCAQMFKGPELSTLCSWTLNGYQVAMGRLKELSMVAENGTAKVRSLISDLGISYILFLISIFAFLFLSSVHRARCMLRLSNIYLIAFSSGQEFGVGLRDFIKKNYYSQKRLFYIYKCSHRKFGNNRKLSGKMSSG